MPEICCFQVSAEEYRKIKGAFESDLHRADVDPQYLYHFGALQSALPCLTDPSKDLTPWWFPKQSFQIIMRLQKPTDIPLHEIARDLGAIALNFNEVIDSVMWGQLGTRKPGIKGTARSKALISRDPHPGRRALLERIWLAGGLIQFWIPELKRSHFSHLHAPKIPLKGEATYLPWEI